MKFTDNQFRYNNLIASSFRQHLSHESHKVAQLTEEFCQEYFELNFQDMFSSSVQDLAASAASKKLKVGNVEDAVLQGDKVGASDVGELNRSLNKVNLLIFSIVCVFNNLI